MQPFFDQQAFDNFLLENNIVEFLREQRTLASGRKSHLYIRFKDITRKASGMKLLTDHIISYAAAHNLDPDTFYGVKEGASPIGLITQYEWAKGAPNYEENNHVLAMGRGKPKPHGSPADEYFIGPPKGDTIIIEDTTTTGSSILQTIGEIAMVPDARVIAVFTLLDRLERRDDGLSAKQAIEARGVPFYALTDAARILPAAYQRLQPADSIVALVQQELDERCITEIPLR